MRLWTEDGAYSGRTLAASLTFVVVHAVRTVAAVFAHTFAKSLKQDGTLEAHFTYAADETRFAEAIGVIIFFDFVHAPFELDAFLSVCFLDRGREYWWSSGCGW